jgi:hypothetical protein
MNSLHPIFQQALAPFISAMGQQPNVEDYKWALQRHDWTHEYADRYADVQRGKVQRQALEQMREELDADGSIWNSIAPKNYQVSA